MVLQIDQFGLGDVWMVFLVVWQSVLFYGAADITKHSYGRQSYCYMLAPDRCRSA